jgi:hypothetical protein
MVEAVKKADEVDCNCLSVVQKNHLLIQKKNETKKRSHNDIAEIKEVSRYEIASLRLPFMTREGNKI